MVSKSIMRKRSVSVASVLILALLIVTSNGKYVDATSLFPIFNNFMLFPRIRCILAFLRFNFDISNFEKYNEYFRNDSSVVMAQTGTYVGPSAIEEYVKFVYGSFSPYFFESGPLSNTSSFVQYKDGQCEYIGLYFVSYTNDTATTTDLLMYGVSNMIKIYLDYRERFISRINVFYTDSFVQVLFGKILNSIPTRRYVCGVMNGPCETILNLPSTYATNTNTCEEMLNMLPSTQGNNGTNNEGVDNYVDGNSQGCRALHAVLAESNPNGHCAHLSFTPMKDPMGNIKCQSSKYVKVSDLFTSDDIERYNEFTESVGIDPTIGHTLDGY